MQSLLQKGHDFEDYVISLFDNKSGKFKLVEWRSDKRASNGMFALSNSYPDLEFVFIGNQRHRFAIECKWREKFIEGKIRWAYKYQIRNYEQYQNEKRIPVFVAIGVGGAPSHPEKLFVTPICHISMYTEVYECNLISFSRNPRHRFFYDTTQLKLF